MLVASSGAFVLLALIYYSLIGKRRNLLHMILPNSKFTCFYIIWMLRIGLLMAHLGVTYAFVGVHVLITTHNSFIFMAAGVMVLGLLVKLRQACFISVMTRSSV